MMLTHKARCNLGRRGPGVLLVCFSRGKMLQSSFSSNCGIPQLSNVCHKYVPVQTQSINAVTKRNELSMGCRRTSKG